MKPKLTQSDNPTVDRVLARVLGLAAIALSALMVGVASDVGEGILIPALLTFTFGVALLTTRMDTRDPPVVPPAAREAYRRGAAGGPQAGEAGAPGTQVPQDGSRAPGRD